MRSEIICGMAIGLAALLAVSPASADGAHVAPIREFAQSTISGWIANPELIAAVVAQNEKHANVTQADIDAMDKKWRSETSAVSRPMIDEVMGRSLSGYLKRKREESGGLVTEIFVMDAKGLNVAQSDVTSDFWQGDEAKWKKTFLIGPKAVFVDQVEEDESTQTFQSQVSMSIVDPVNGQLIGAITVGVNVDALM